MCIFSIQGDLESRVGEVDMGGKLIGDLSFSKDGSNTPLLIIGHHILYGKLVKMENPMVVMHKVRKTQVISKQVKPRFTTTSRATNSIKKLRKIPNVNKYSNLHG